MAGFDGFGFFGADFRFFGLLSLADVSFRLIWYFPELPSDLPG